MLATKIWNYVRGYVIILVEGRFIEKFLNLCIRNRIFPWDLQRTGQTTALMKTGIKGFKAIRPAARGARCRISILKKRGLPFLINRYRRRKVFALGVLVFAGILNIFAMFVWDIRVEGADKEYRAEIEKVLADMGIGLGAFKYKIDPDTVANAVMLEMDRLAWCGVEVRGTRLKIRLKERNMPPDIVPVDEPCNIVAKMDGLIESMDVKSGQELVKPGDMVKKGQILVSGIVESRIEEGNAMFVHAIASIRARTWYEGVGEAGPFITEKERTGREKTVRYLEIFGKRIRLPFAKVDFQQYELTEESKRFTIGKDTVLPFGLTTQKYAEYREVSRRISDDEARRIAGDMAYSRALSHIDQSARIVATELAFDTADGRTRARVVIECKEEIGTEQRIGGN